MMLPLHLLVFICVVAVPVSYFGGTIARPYLAQTAYVNQSGMIDRYYFTIKDLFGGSKDMIQSTSKSNGWIQNTEADEDEDEMDVVDDDEDEDDEDEEEEDRPVGNHLLVDIHGVDRGLLESEEKLKDIILQLVEEKHDFHLKYVYSHRAPRGGNVLIGGVSKRKHHVWLHSWPDEGVVTLDMFGARSSNFFTIVPEVERVFGATAQNKTEASDTTIRWAHKPRGFHDSLSEAEKNELADLHWFPAGVMLDYKKEVASTQSPFQQISIWDVMTPDRGTLGSYQRSLSNDHSYESLHPELFEPDRIVFLDGLLQSRRVGDAAYHEALVHPTLFAHPNPRRVAIIGGGEGATLREVLKHNTVEEVVMIEIDEVMVNFSREFLSEWSNCSDLAGRADSCFEDPRTTLYCEDAFRWFKDHFSKPLSQESGELFDVIIMDALDPQGLQDIVEALYTDDEFYQALFNGLSSDGILISQVGEGSWSDDPFYALGEDRHYGSFLKGLKSLGFYKITNYIEGGCGFFSPWGFVVASKQQNTLEDLWFQNEALINLKIRQRLVPTKQGDSPLFFFDGATMQTYQYPTRIDELLHCRNPVMPKNCRLGHGYDPSVGNVPLSEVLKSVQRDDENFCLHLNTPADSYVGLEALVHSVFMEPATIQVLAKSNKQSGAIDVWSEAAFSYQDSFGVHARLGRFVPTSPVFWCYTMTASCPRDNFIEPDDLVRQRQSLALQVVHERILCPEYEQTRGLDADEPACAA
eukprot:CAMPEP_0178849840 /NCGR_PEP_ID=MMETSP0746-20121128/20175_1 /TAXON_ID=913974 /ORGANISM="Nitzschia punctata, Strain CCMP561" /LENGTH=749 /DNA_ID=CAMNT_0020515109 /DNA_START=81 /DNA_END=2330 /DNA_ORIENTATION=+